MDWIDQVEMQEQQKIYRQIDWQRNEIAYKYDLIAEHKQSAEYYRSFASELKRQQYQARFKPSQYRHVSGDILTNMLEDVITNIGNTFKFAQAKLKQNDLSRKEMLCREYTAMHNRAVTELYTDIALRKRQITELERRAARVSRDAENFRKIAYPRGQELPRRQELPEPERKFDTIDPFKNARETEKTDWKADLRQSIDSARAESRDFKDFKSILARQGIDVTLRGDNIISFRHPQIGTNIRGTSLGDNYGREAIAKDIAVNSREPEPDREAPEPTPEAPEPDRKNVVYEYRNTHPFEIMIEAGARCRKEATPENWREFESRRKAWFAYRDERISEMDKQERDRERNPSRGR